MTSLWTQCFLLVSWRGCRYSISTKQEAPQAWHCFSQIRTGWNRQQTVGRRPRHTHSVKTWDSLSPCAAHKKIMSLQEMLAPLWAPRCFIVTFESRRSASLFLKDKSPAVFPKPRRSGRCLQNPQRFLSNKARLQLNLHDGNQNLKLLLLAPFIYINIISIILINTKWHSPFMKCPQSGLRNFRPSQQGKGMDRKNFRILENTCKPAVSFVNYLWGFFQSLPGIYLHEKWRLCSVTRM